MKEEFLLTIFYFYTTPWKFNLFFKISNVIVYWNESDWPRPSIRKFKFSFGKIVVLLSNFCCISTVLTKNFSTSVRYPYFAFWKACKKCVFWRFSDDFWHYIFYTLPKMRNMDFDHSLKSSSWVQSIYNKNYKAN
jgi:hypothetical protein